MKKALKTDLDYLKNKPIRIQWKVIAGGELHPCQMYDLVFDEYDLKIRQLDNEDNRLYLREAQKS